MRIMFLNVFTSFLLALFFSLGLAVTASAQVEIEEGSELTLKTVEGVQFLVEPDREIEHDPVTGILIPEPIDRYVARKYRTIQDETQREIIRLEAKIQALEDKLNRLENALRRPLLDLQPAAPEEAP